MLENGLPVDRKLMLAGRQPDGVPPVTSAPGGPAEDFTDGSSPKIARLGFGGGKISRGGFGVGGCVIVLPGSVVPVTLRSSLTWFARRALGLMFSLLKTRSSGA